MYEMVEGWLFQPGTVKGVRWTVHEVKTANNGVDETEAITSSVLQLLAGVKVRRVLVLRLEPLVTTTPYVADHENLAFYLADGVAEFATVHPDAHSIRETRLMYPGHGMVVPQGVLYAASAITKAVMVVSSDREDAEKARPVLLEDEIRWLIHRPRSE